jgi:outer membrane protein
MDSRESWIHTAQIQSPSLKQVALGVQMSKYQDRIVKSERLPKLALVAGNHFDGPITIEVPPINQNFNYWYVGIGLKYSLSSLYKSGKSIRRSRFAMQRAAEQYEEAKEQTELTVKADYVRYMEAYEQLKTQIKSVELANQNYAVVYNRYKNEMALITDMLDASNSKLSAEVQLVNARIQIVFNYYKLHFTSGGLIELRVS